jgi:hypothetical protein
MPANLEQETVDYRPLVLRGAEAGLASGVLIGALEMAYIGFVNRGTDVWSFPKVVATIALGDGAAHPLTGFEPGPVAAGILIHLVIATLLGMLFALLAGFMSLKDPPVLLLSGITYGVVVYFATYVIIAGALFPEFQRLPALAFFAVHPVFGLAAALLLHHWADRWDMGPAPRGQELTWSSPEATGFHAVVALLVLFAVGVALGGLGLDARAILTLLGALVVAAIVGRLYHVHLPRPHPHLPRGGRRPAG